MELLLDTHAALWWADDPLQLSDAAQVAIAAPTNVVWFTAASAWELSIKVRSGKLALDVPRFVSLLTQGGIRLLGIGIDDAITAGSLDWAHRDPFDRMIVAQASRLNLMLVTRDAEIQTFVDARSVLAA
jgi:PIN domain nuclease of toxin-antitoxin system